jgi:anti-sigma regulatory factor (Ser/Thr protein kinase)
MGTDAASQSHLAAGEAGQRHAWRTGIAADALRWRQVFRGEERQLGEMRRWLTSLLPECPSRHDVLTVANELSSNAIRHTASGSGSWFAVEVTKNDSVVQVAVADWGGPDEPHVIEDPDGEHGRGLLLVRDLSVRTGVVGDRRGRLVWAQIAWTDPGPADPAASADPYQAAIREGEATLARRFAGVPAWFGRSTLRWWAVAGSEGLVSAPSAAELAGLLYRLLDASVLVIGDAQRGAAERQVSGQDHRADAGRRDSGQRRRQHFDAARTGTRRPGSAHDRGHGRPAVPRHLALVPTGTSLVCA